VQLPKCSFIIAPTMLRGRWSPLIGLLTVFLPNLDAGVRPDRLLSVTPDSFAKR
jgi:hypothetical protein